ncbi:MAG: hypothetical protein ACO3JL_14050 [Myxococcota bacterium]
MILFRNVLTFIGATAVFGGCASTPNTSAGSAAAEHSFTAEDLNGTWSGPCFASPQGDGSYNQLTFRMTATDWDLDYGAFGDDACTAKFLTVNIQGPYELGGASSVAPGAREGKFGFAKKTVTPHMDAAVGVINGACGATTAAVGEAFDLSAGCAGLGAYPIQDCGSDYDIVMLSGDTLHFGSRPADNNMCTPEKRPTKFEGGAQVKRQ